LIKKTVLLIAAITLVLIYQIDNARATEITVGGTGMSLGTMHIAGEAFTAKYPDMYVLVPPSMGSGGGIKALIDDVIDLSLTARPLRRNEVAAGLTEELCVRTSLVFVSQPRFASDVKLENLPSLYHEFDPRWPDGTPLKAILRTRSGSEMPYLSDRVPGLADAFMKARARPDTLIGMTDQLNASHAEIIKGSLAIASQMQMLSERLRLKPMSIDGIFPGVASLKDGSYPFSMRICAISKRSNSKTVTKQFIGFLKSEEGEAIFNRVGALLER